MKNNRTKAAVFCSVLLVRHRIVPILLSEAALMLLLILMFNRTFVPVAGNDLAISALMFVSGYEFFEEICSLRSAYGLTRRTGVISFSAASAAFLLLIAAADTAARHIVNNYMLQGRHSSLTYTYSGISVICGIISLKARPLPIPLELLLTFITILFAWCAGAMICSLVQRGGKKAALITIAVSVIISALSVTAAFGVKLPPVMALPALMMQSVPSAAVTMLALAAIFVAAAFFIPQKKEEEP